jgi:hypothetical protein
MEYTFKVKKEYTHNDEKHTELDIYVDGISESSGELLFVTYADMGACLEHYKLQTDQTYFSNPKAVELYGAKSLYVSSQFKVYPMLAKEAPKYPSRLDDSEFFDFGTIVVFDDAFFKADAASRFSHLPYPKSDLEYWDLVKQGLEFMIKHADASTLGWVMSFRDYNNIPMLNWVKDEGFERLLVQDKKLRFGYIKSKQQEDVFVILR